MATPDPAALLPLAESVADGSTIDWDAVEARASHDERGIVRQLRILSSLAMLHRSLSGETTMSLPTVGRRTASAPAIGVWAHLELLERLGGGAFADVYRAWDRHLEREVALKLLRLDEPPGDFRTSRVTDEGRLLARVHHGNVVAVHGVAVQDGRVGLWMELIRGATLEQQLQKQGPFSAREAALAGIDLCRALAAIHSAGLIHRDVKAQNVMREDGGRIVLMDLGTGREIDPSRRLLPDLAGTPLYLAPEIFNGGTASERTDLYSLGVLLYHLVTGSFPVLATTIEELQAGHTQGAAVRLRDARADLPTAFVRVVDRAIAADPDKRYPSAGALEAELGDAFDETAASSARRRWLFTWPHAGMLTAALAAALALVAWPSIRERRALTATASSIRSIAVLPMTNLSGDSLQEYFADGMTEALIDDLARVRALRVISRTSMMQYKGTKKTLREVAAALNVDAVLEASVLRSGDRVRISADLVHVASDRHVWVESYERDVRDVLALQSDVARTIAREVQIQLTPQEQAGLAVNRTVAPAAQEAYLRGRFYWNKRTDEGLQTALGYFRQAIAIDPSFARGHAGEADVYNLLPGGMSPFTAYPLAKAAAVKALEIDPTLAEAHTSLAFAQFIFDRDYPGAEAAFLRALQFNPGYATGHHWYGEYLSAMGRLDEAFAEFEQARRLDPLSAGLQTSIGSTLYMAHRYDEAISQLRASLEIDRDSPSTYFYLGLTYAQKGLLREANTEIRQGIAKAGRTASLQAALGVLAAFAGDRTDALTIARELGSRVPSVRFVTNVAYIYANVGEKDRAFEILTRAERERCPTLLWAKLDPMLDPLRTDPRFAFVMRTLRLPQ